MSWQGYVIEQTTSALNTTEVPFSAWYLRTGDGHEIDLILQFGVELWAVEIKLTTEPTPATFGKLNKTADLIAADKRFLISRNKQFTQSERQIACDLPGFIEYMNGRLKIYNEV